jgi:hypothetical protein
VFHRKRRDNIFVRILPLRTGAFVRASVTVRRRSMREVEALTAVVIVRWHCLAAVVFVKSKVAGPSCPLGLLPWPVARVMPMRFRNAVIIHVILRWTVI